MSRRSDRASLADIPDDTTPPEVGEDVGSLDEDEIPLELVSESGKDTGEEDAKEL